MTVQEAKAEQQSVVAEFFTEVSKRMEAGESYELEVMDVCKERADLLVREHSLRDHIKELGRAAESIGVAEIRASAARQMGAGATYVISLASNGGRSGRMPIAQLGVRYKGKQKIEITRPMLAEVVANFRERESGEVPADYDHAIEIAAGAGEPAPAAGWLKSIEEAPDGQGILWGTVQWTARAAAMIQAGEYKFISPVLDPNVRDNKTGDPQGWTLTSAALTNTPILQGMPALVLSERGWDLDDVRREEQQVQHNDGDGVQVEIAARVKQTMAAKQLGYSEALRAVMMDDRDLHRRWLATMGGTADARPLAAQVDSEIDSLVKAKVAASEGRMGYAGAYKWVLAERPDLARRRAAAMR